MNASSPDLAQHHADTFSLMANLTKRWLLKPDIMPFHSKHSSISIISRTADDGLCDTPAIFGLSDFFAEPFQFYDRYAIDLCELIRALYLGRMRSEETKDEAN